MKWLITLLVFVAACNSTKNLVSDEQLNGSWQLVMFPGDGKELAEAFAQRKPELTFETANNRVGGSTGCNRISGTYKMTKDSFLFDPNMIMTKMACPGYDENIFVEAMGRVNRIELKNDLLYLKQDTTMIMAFSKKQ